MARLTYKKAGVDIDKADRFIKKIKPLIEKTRRKEVIGKIGAFSGFFRPALKGLKDPILVSSTDGVGTKLLIAELLKKYDTVGIDLVAMCVNDVVVMGAEPIFFLDYLASGRLESEKLFELTKGITSGCRDAGCALIGGETAELPGLYEKDKFDLAGFCVGLVDRKKILDGTKVTKGDSIIGLASNGLHSNGFSLVRRIFSRSEMKGRLGLELLRPTRIYVKPILQTIRKYNVKSMAHITGGGFYDNIPRALPKGLGAKINKGSWPIPRIFREVQRKGNIEEREMFRTFNMGIGMVLIAGSKDTKKIIALLKRMGIKSWAIGEVVKGKRGVKIVNGKRSK